MKYIIANLKSSLLTEELEHYINHINKKLLRNNKIIIAPSFIYLKEFLNTGFNVASQNVFHEEGANYTGVITVKQLKSMGVKYSIVGYGDVRTNFKESEEMLLKKVKLALKNNIKIIYCIGESQEQKAMKKTYQVLKNQLKGILALEPEYWSDIIVAYEPLWAIGSGDTPTMLEIEEMVDYIKDLFGNQIDLVYGGSVNKNNIKTITQIKKLDGVIVGKATYNSLHLVDLVDAIYDEK